MRGSPIVKLIKVGLLLGALGGLIVGGLFLYEFYYGPRMKVQPNLRTFEAWMPPLPAGTVPISPEPFLPEEMEEATNPLEATEAAVARGEVYYTYYCLACHGENWDGNGPVGQSYMPVPTDLTAPKVQEYSDGKLFKAMLTGTGHEPVLERVVLPEHRWYLVLYVRALPEQKRSLESRWERFDALQNIDPSLVK